MIQKTNVLHVSDSKNTSNVVRVVVGCQSFTDQLEDTFCRLGFRVHRTHESLPKRSESEMRRAKELLEIAVKSVDV
jgi:hypothetical protein